MWISEGCDSTHNSSNLRSNWAIDISNLQRSTVQSLEMEFQYPAIRGITFYSVTYSRVTDSVTLKVPLLFFLFITLFHFHVGSSLFTVPCHGNVVLLASWDAGRHSVYVSFGPHCLVNFSHLPTWGSYSALGPTNCLCIAWVWTFLEISPVYQKYYFQL